MKWAHSSARRKPTLALVWVPFHCPIPSLHSNMEMKLGDASSL
jgi:hypothetical protein